MKCKCFVRVDSIGQSFPCVVEAAPGSDFCTYCGGFCQAPPDTDEGRLSRVRTLVADAERAGLPDVTVVSLKHALGDVNTQQRGTAT